MKYWTKDQVEDYITEQSFRPESEAPIHLNFKAVYIAFDDEGNLIDPPNGIEELSRTKL